MRGDASFRPSLGLGVQVGGGVLGLLKLTKAAKLSKLVNWKTLSTPGVNLTRHFPDVHLSGSRSYSMQTSAFINSRGIYIYVYVLIIYLQYI